MNSGIEFQVGYVDKGKGVGRFSQKDRLHHFKRKVYSWCTRDIRLRVFISATNFLFAQSQGEFPFGTEPTQN